MFTTYLETYRAKRVLVTGSTGFKGSWLCQWLLNLGAEVYGYALLPETNPALFDQLSLEKNMRQYYNDIRSFADVKKCIQEVKPDIILHLAAQPLVRESYITPRETVDTNVMGTINLLEAVRELKLSTNIVVITSDKCYENQEWFFGYRETDPMGGYDPYSASKGMAELAVSSWRRSFFNPSSFNSHGVKLASARAGNVIGGGDWAKDRIVPDCIRFLQERKPIQVRNPYATRPWQHVLEPLGGYLLLGAKLMEAAGEDMVQYCDGFNIGPYVSSNKPVHQLVEEILKNWGSGTWNYSKEHAVHEASLLHLTIDKAYHILGWQPAWNFEVTIQKTVDWYKEIFHNTDLAKELTNKQIIQYTSDFRLNVKEILP